MPLHCAVHVTAALNLEISGTQCIHYHPGWQLPYSIGNKGISAATGLGKSNTGLGVAFQNALWVISVTVVACGMHVSPSPAGLFSVNQKKIKNLPRPESEGLPTAWPC